MKTLAIGIVGISVALYAPGTRVVSAQTPSHPKAGASISGGPAAALRQDMRKLWTDHVVWTRAYTVAALGDQPEAPAAANRLMKNQEFRVDTASFCA